MISTRLMAFLWCLDHVYGFNSLLNRCNSSTGGVFSGSTLELCNNSCGMTNFCSLFESETECFEPWGCIQLDIKDTKQTCNYLQCDYRDNGRAGNVFKLSHVDRLAYVAPLVVPSQYEIL